MASDDTIRGLGKYYLDRCGGTPAQILTFLTIELIERLACTNMEQKDFQKTLEKMMKIFLDLKKLINEMDKHKESNE